MFVSVTSSTAVTVSLVASVCALTLAIPIYNSANNRKVKTYNADVFTANASTFDTKLNADTLLTDLKAGIDARSIPNLTVTKLETSLELERVIILLSP